jgi:hypothetical protein
MQVMTVDSLFESNILHLLNPQVTFRVDEPSPNGNC